LNMIDYERLVNEFSRLMLKRLLEKRRDYGDSWVNVPLMRLRGRLWSEVHEWLRAVWSGNEIQELEELVDIANQCLLLYFRLLNGGRLK